MKPMKRLGKVKKLNKAFRHITKGNWLLDAAMLDDKELQEAYVEYMEAFQNLIIESMKSTLRAKEHDSFDDIMGKNFK